MKSLIKKGSLTLSAIFLAVPSFAADVAPPAKGPPLPVHTIEGYGGGAITPTAYLVNPGPKDSFFGLPATSLTYANIGHGKNVETAAVTETLFGRLELGYGLSRFGIGEVKQDIQDATGVDVGRDDVYLHNFNARYLAIEENSFGTNWVPAVTAGVHYKINDGIDSLDHRLGGAFSNIGLESNQGVDLTLTASKTIPNVFGRPLILTGGLRNSDAAWLGYLGFGGERHTTFEGSAIYLPLDWLAVGYEFRQKVDPYETIPGLVEEEDNLQAVSLIFIPNNHLNIALVYGAFGKVLNKDENQVLAVQLKWEF